MSRKQRGQRAAATTSNRKGVQPSGTVNSTGPAFHSSPDGLHANVLTWTGPGIENVFIDFERAKRRRGRALPWKVGNLDSCGERSERPDDNG